MVSPEFVGYLVGVANEKMEANRKRTEGFFRALQRSGGFAECDGGDRTAVDAALSDGNGSMCGEGAHVHVEERDGDTHLGNLIDIRINYQLS